MVKTIRTYLKISITPTKMLAKSEKALNVFKKMITSLQEDNLEIAQAKKEQTDTINQLQIQIEVAKVTNIAFDKVEELNTKRIGKIKSWLNELD